MPDKHQTTILILGAGAVGAFYASRLALSTSPRASLSVVCRSNYSAVSKHGFQLSSPTFKDYNFRPTNTFSSPDEAQRAGLTWDYIVVSTKALPDVSDDSELLEGLVSKETAIVLIQNGLGVEEPYTRRFPDTPVLSAVTIVSAAQTEHGVIKHNRWTRISVGPYLPHLDSGSTEPRASDEEAVRKNRQFVDILRSGGVKDAEVYDHSTLQLVRWHKIAINASMNPSSVLSNGTSNGTMATDPELSILLAGVMHEVLTTAPKILNKPFPASFATADRILASTRKNTTGSRPSMALDWEAGRKMELEVILGNPLRIARDKGFEMPRLQTLYALLRMAQENRDKQRENKAKAKM